MRLACIVSMLSPWLACMDHCVPNSSWRARETWRESRSCDRVRVAAVRAECDPKFSDVAIYEHCLPFNVARAYDEARGMDTPRIWTAERDQEMWAALQG